MAKFRFTDNILKETSDYIIINKPPFISTLEDRVASENILSLARDYHQDAQVCHRLDKETSGVMVIAKNPEAYRHMSMQLEHRKVIKIYHAISEGLHNFKDLKVELPLRTMGNGKVQIDFRQGKEAYTEFGTLQTYQKHTLVECRPRTGRMHQIRVHLAHLKAPISGDENYGGHPFYLSSVKRKFHLKQGTEEQPLIRRLALHARTIKFEGIDGKIIEGEAPYPKDFSVLVKQLSKNS